MIVQQQSTQLGGASVYGSGEYGAGLYGQDADNFVVITPTQGEVWSIDSVICSTASVSFTQFAVYLNVLDLTGLLGTSINGNLDTVELPEEMVMRSNDALICIWFGGDPGSLATASLIGGIFEPE